MMKKIYYVFALMYANFYESEDYDNLFDRLPRIKNKKLTNKK